MSDSPFDEAAPELTAAQQAMVRTLDAHFQAEVVDRDIEATMATMTPEPYHVLAPVGPSIGAAAVRAYYTDVLMEQLPPDMETIPLSRTVGTNRIVEEFISRFTHTIHMDWLLPGIPPTGKRVEHAMVVIFEFENGKIAGERIYWDHASVLAQVGVHDLTQAAVADASVASTLVQVTAGCAP